MAWNDHIKGTEAEALEAVKLCVSLGLDVNAATDKGETALHGAAHRGADTIAKYLVDKGANVNAATSADSRRSISPWARAATTAAPARCMKPPRPSSVRPAASPDKRSKKPPRPR